MTKPLLPKAIIVGAPNLMKATQVPSLVRHYTMPLDTEFIRSIAFASIQVDQNSKYLKKDFLIDAEGLIEYAGVHDVKVIGCTNPKFWQFATGDKQFTANIGKAFEGIGDFIGFKIVPLLNYFVLLAKPQAQTDLSKGVDTLNAVLNGTYNFNEENLADKVVKHLVTDLKEASKVFDYLIKQPLVTMDIETTGLTFGKERVITIAFTNSTKEGWAFPMCEEFSKDYMEMTKLVATFLKNYRGKHIWHNHLFDIPFVMREIMKVPFTNQKLINRIVNNMDIEDTLHIAYLCKNSTFRESLGLKDLIFPKYGVYDAGVDQSRLLDYSFEEVGTYNVLDVTATMEVYEEYYPKMVAEEQEDIFINYYKVSSKTLMKLKYRGVDVDLLATNDAKQELDSLLRTEYEFLASNEHIADTEYNLNINAMYKYNSSHKKQKTAGDFDLKFNPGSSTQKAILLFDVMELPVLETTKTGNPATGKDVLAQLQGATTNEDDIELLKCLARISEAAKISSAFMVSFEELAVKAEDGSYRLHGDFKLTGTVSGRLSAANPNLQQVPSGSTYGNLVQGLFKAPEGMIFWGSDFSSLETHVGAIITKDAALRKVLLEGYDSHSLYTAVYFEEELKERGLPYGANITAEESFIIAKEAKDLRQQSKSVTFGFDILDPLVA